MMEMDIRSVSGESSRSSSYRLALNERTGVQGRTRAVLTAHSSPPTPFKSATDSHCAAGVTERLKRSEISIQKINKKEYKSGCS